MGDGLSLLNGFLQNISLICAVTSTILKHTTYTTYFGHYLLSEVKKIVLIPISMSWMGINSPIGVVLSAINGLSQKKSTRNDLLKSRKRCRHPKNCGR
jgi:hypothetical protein